MSVLFCKLCGNNRLTSIVHTRTFDVLECKSCKIAFTHPAPVVPDYTKMDFHSAKVDEKAERLTYKEDLPVDWQHLIHIQAELIANNFGKDAAILEIGCGEGILMNEIKKAGFKDVQGIEPSVTASRRALVKQLTVTNGYFNAQAVNKEYDLVIMSHVYEHVEDPYDFIRQVTSILKKDRGSIMLTQTNYRGLLPRWKKEQWYAWVPDQHFWHFTPVGLEKILMKDKLAISQLQYCSLVHPHDLLYKLAGIIPSLLDQFVLLASRKK